MKKIMFNDKIGLTQAVLEGRKTMTRRIITHPSKFRGYNVCGYYVCRKPSGEVTEVCMYDEDERMIDEGQIFSKYQVGEVIAIAQSYESVYHECGLETMDMLVSRLKYNAGWTNKMFTKSFLMPHHIEITGIKVERLQDISEEDCLKEGIIKGKCGSESTHFMNAYYVPKEKQPYCTPRDAFEILIDKVTGKGVFQSNPYVFVYEFNLIE